jgi:uroporphyrinogen decarboxylase
MTSRELVIKALNHEAVPRVPRDLWVPTGDASRADELSEINVRYPSDIVTPGPTSHGKRPQGKPGKAGEQTDAWGCVWHVGPDGTPVELKHSPLAEASQIASYRPPAELLDHARFAKANRVCPATSRFVLAWSEVRPFDRLRQLRGSEAALMDLAKDAPATRGLLAMLHEFACKEIEHWARTEVDGVVFRDDWCTADGPLISPEMWRELFRPLYREYCRMLQARDKFVFFHSDGNIAEMFGDVVKTGIDAIHCQLHLMDFERLTKRYRGRVTFWGGMEHERLENPGTAEEFRQAVLEIRRALDYGSGGVIAQCQWDPGVRLQTIAAFFEQWLVPVPMRG